MSDRLSGRVVEPGASDLLAEGVSVNSGEEATRSGAPLRRVGRRQLDRVRKALSDRDLAVLRSIEACHYLTTTQLERLWFQGTGMTALAAARGSRRTLERLKQLGLIEHLERRVGGVRAGSASYVWMLSGLGQRSLGGDQRRRRHEPGVRHLDHVLAVGELVVRIHEQARGGELQIVAVETEPSCWRPVVTAHGGRELLKPDLRLTLGTGEFELHWNVEVDRSTEHRPTLRRKADAYVRAWREGGEQRRAGVAPRVLWITPDEARRVVVDEVLRETSAPVGMFATSTDASAINALRGPLT